MSLRLRVLVPVFFLLCGCTLLSAQEVVLKAGVIFPQEIKNESPFTSSPSRGYNFGVQTIYGSDWNIITGIDYIINNIGLEGEISDSSGMSSFVSDDLKMQTFNVPIYVSRNFSGEDVGIRPLLGFDISFILGMNDNRFGLVKDDLDKIQLWLVGGLAIDLNNIVLSGKYSYGLDRYFQAEENNLRFGYVSASIGYRL